MLLALRDRLHQEDDGFTLIELLVVIIIIGILAAIAIPVFLNQRQSGWRGAVQSDLRNSAIEMETLLTDEGSYACEEATGVVGDPPCPNFPESEEVTITPVRATSSAYCLEGTRTDLGETWSYASDQSPNLQEAPC